MPLATLAGRFSAWAGSKEAAGNDQEPRTKAIAVVVCSKARRAGVTPKQGNCLGIRSLGMFAHYERERERVMVRMVELGASSWPAAPPGAVSAAHDGERLTGAWDLSVMQLGQNIVAGGLILDLHVRADG